MGALAPKIDLKDCRVRGNYNNEEIVIEEYKFDINNIDIDKLEESQQYINKIHREDGKYITVAIIDKMQNFRQQHYTLEEIHNKQILERLHSLQLNTYVSLNSFYMTKRSSDTVRRLNALYVDIDNHNKNIRVTKEMIVDLMEHLKENYYNKSIPIPTITVSSGRGLQLIMLLEHLPKHGLQFWQNTENELVNRLRKLDYKGFKVDDNCTDATRVLRLPGTFNLKSNTYAELLEINDNLYRLDDLKEKYFTNLDKRPKNKPKNKVVGIRAGQKAYNAYEINWKRREDLITLQELRNGKCEGKREFMCFLYRYFTCLIENNYDEAIEKMLQFNQKFTEPLKLNEVITATRSAEKAYKVYIENLDADGKLIVCENGNYKFKGYIYTHKKLIKELEITEEEQKELLVIISKSEKYARNNKTRRETRRNNNGLTKKQQEIQDLKVKILELKGNGLSLRKIAEELGITLGKVQRCIKK